VHILIGLLRAIVLLYFWLSGHWFARVLAFLLFAALGFVGGAGFASAANPNDHAFPLICGLTAAAIAWPLASLPRYYWRWQAGQRGYHY
jgi:hypothetical protein